MGFLFSGETNRTSLSYEQHCVCKCTVQLDGEHNNRAEKASVSALLSHSVREGMSDEYSSLSCWLFRLEMEKLCDFE